ncbi:MAG: hypothetical protein ACYC2Y_10220 [Armatimonadota bacterium]
MDIEAVGLRLEAGEALKIKYRYPSTEDGDGPRYGVRTDKLLDVSVELGRYYTNFRGVTPIWLEEDEVVEVFRDDGLYEDFAD